MEGCKTCETYEFGCCDDGLTEASGPDGEASCNTGLFSIDCYSFSSLLGLWL